MTYPMSSITRQSPGTARMPSPAENDLPQLYMGSSAAPVLFTTKEAARFLRVSHRTLEDWRQKGCGPRFQKWGRLVRYSRFELEHFGSQALFCNTGEATAVQ